MNAIFPTTRAQERDGSLIRFRMQSALEMRNYIRLARLQLNYARERERWAREYRAAGWHTFEAREALAAHKLRADARTSLNAARRARKYATLEVQYHAH